MVFVTSSLLRYRCDCVGVRNNSTNAREISVSRLVSDINSGRVMRFLRRMKACSRRPTITCHPHAQVPANSDDPVRCLHRWALIKNGLAMLNLSSPSRVSLNWIGLLAHSSRCSLHRRIHHLMLRQAQGSNNQALSFGKSARGFHWRPAAVTFEDVAGADKKGKTARGREFPRTQTLHSACARSRRVCCWSGILVRVRRCSAKAVAARRALPFFSFSGSELSRCSRRGDSRVRDLFDQAMRHSPCIIFVTRSTRSGASAAGFSAAPRRSASKTSIRSWLSGRLCTDTNVIIVAATNRPDILDPALLLGAFRSPRRA